MVLIAAQADGNKIGRIRLARIANASATSIEPAIAQAIEPGASIHTDDWNGYCGLKALGYERHIIRRTAVVGDNLLPRANRVAALLKRWLLGTHQGAVSIAHLELLLGRIHFPI